jgi:hypothetical protein
MNVITNKAELIAAIDYYKDTLDLLPSEKYSLATEIYNKSQELGEPSIDRDIIKIATAPANNTQAIVKGLISREEYLPDSNSLKGFTKIIEQAKKPTTKLAALEAFDLEYGLDKMWDKYITNPLDIVFNTKEKPVKVFKIASGVVTQDNIVNKKDQLKKYFKTTFVDKLASDPEKTISELPDKVQGLLYSLIND